MELSRHAWLLMILMLRYPRLEISRTNIGQCALPSARWMGHGQLLFVNGARAAVICEWGTGSCYLWMQHRQLLFVNAARAAVICEWFTSSCYLWMGHGHLLFVNAARAAVICEWFTSSCYLWMGHGQLLFVNAWTVVTQMNQIVCPTTSSTSFSYK